MYQPLVKAIPNYIVLPSETLTYKALQHIITEDDGWRMFKHVLRKRSPHLGGKAEYIGRYIYDMQTISSE